MKIHGFRKLTVLACCLLLPLLFVLFLPSQVQAAPLLSTVNNFNWAGYSVSLQPNLSSTTSVSMAWNIPSVSCYQNGKPISGTIGIWPGLGGIGANTLEQIGTASQCTNGQASYWAWYELFPSMSQPHHLLQDGNYPVSAGDSMRADVTNQGGGYFVLRLFNDSKHWYYTKIWLNQGSNVAPASADCILEDQAAGTFPQFYKEQINNCVWVQNGTQQPLTSGTNLTRYNIVRSTNLPPFSTSIATTIDIFPDGKTFAIYWNKF